MTGLTIGKAAERAGVKIDTLRYYERQGVIAPPERNGSNYRVYAEDAVLRVSEEATCADVRDQALAKVADLDQKVRSLEAMRRVL